MKPTSLQELNSSLNRYFFCQRPQRRKSKVQRFLDAQKNELAKRAFDSKQKEKHK